MKHLDFSKLELVERNPEDYKKYGTQYLIHGTDMFRLQTLFASGCVYKLPFIPQAGDMAEGCYLTYNDDTEQMLIYHMNGYIQPVFSMNFYNDYVFKHMDSMPNEYIARVESFIRESLTTNE